MRMAGDSVLARSQFSEAWLTPIAAVARARGEDFQTIKIVLIETENWSCGCVAGGGDVRGRLQEVNVERARARCTDSIADVRAEWLLPAKAPKSKSHGV